MKNSGAYHGKINRAFTFLTGPLWQAFIAFRTRGVFYLSIFRRSCIFIYMSTYKYIDENEDKGIFYLSQIVRDGWKITRTEDYCHWDATITKGGKSYNVENKVRYIDQKLADKGLLMDANKVDENIEYYIEYLPKAGNAYLITYDQIQDGLKEGTIKKDTQKCALHMFEDPNYKVEKNNYLIPINLFRRFTITG